MLLPKLLHSIENGCWRTDNQNLWQYAFRTLALCPDIETFLSLSRSRKGMNKKHPSGGTQYSSQPSQTHTTSDRKITPIY